MVLRLSGRSEYLNQHLNARGVPCHTVAACRLFGEPDVWQIIPT